MPKPKLKKLAQKQTELDALKRQAAEERKLLKELSDNRATRALLDSDDEPETPEEPILMGSAMDPGLEAALAEADEEGGRIIISRCRKGEREFALMGEFAPGAWEDGLKDLLNQHGGGRYRVEIRHPNGTYLKRFSRYYDESVYKPRAEAVAASTSPDFLGLIKVMNDQSKEAQDRAEKQSNRMTELMLGLFQTMAASQKPAIDPLMLKLLDKNDGVTVKDLLPILTFAADMKNTETPSNGSELVMSIVSKLVDKYADRIPALLAAAQARNSQPAPALPGPGTLTSGAPAGPRVTAKADPTPSPRPATPSAGPIPAPKEDPMALAVESLYLDARLGTPADIEADKVWAHFGSDPKMVSDFIARPDFADLITLIEPRLTAFRPWLEEVAKEVQAIAKEEESEVSAEPPALVNGTNKQSAEHP